VVGSSKAGSPAPGAAGVSSGRGSSEAKDLATETLKEPKPAEDVVVVHSRTEDGEGMNVVRKQGDELSLAVLRPLKEGKPIVGDVVKLKPREEHPALFDVETEVVIPQPKRMTAGPSRVANPSYRKGWDSLWGGRRRRHKPN
jgi:hypothetical protein